MLLWLSWSGGSHSETGQPSSRRSAAERNRLVTAVVLTLVVALPIAGFLGWDLSHAGRFAFKRPWALLLLLAVPLAFWVRLVIDHRRRAFFGYSSTATLSRMRPGLWARLAPLPGVLRTVAIALLAIALAGPQTRDRGGRVALFDLKHDPREQNDLSDQLPKIRDRLAARLDAYLEEAGAGEERYKLDDGLRDQLRALGYMQ